MSPQDKFVLTVVQWCRLCELNVIRQVFNICSSPTVQAAWDSGKPLSVHGLAYSLKDGLLKVGHALLVASGKTVQGMQVDGRVLLSMGVQIVFIPLCVNGRKHVPVYYMYEPIDRTCAQIYVRVHTLLRVLFTGFEPTYMCVSLSTCSYMWAGVHTYPWVLELFLFPILVNWATKYHVFLSARPSDFK